MTRARLETLATWALFGCAATVQVSIAAAEACLGVSALAWLVLVLRGDVRVEAPMFFRPLALYAVLTLSPRSSRSPPLRACTTRASCCCT